MSFQRHKKHVISISLGSSERDAKATVVLGEQELLVERRGTDGDFAKARQLMEECDGKVDAIGLGGTDLFVYAGDTRYTFRESAKLIANVKNTPVLDGSGLKNSLERRLIAKLAAAKIVDFKDKKVLLAAHQGTFGGNICTNTISSGKNALLHGADIIEADVTRDLDGVLYIDRL